MRSQRIKPSLSWCSEIQDPAMYRSSAPRKSVGRLRWGRGLGCWCLLVVCILLMLEGQAATALSEAAGPDSLGRECIRFPRGGSARVDCLEKRTNLFADPHCSPTSLMAHVVGDAALLALAPLSVAQTSSGKNDGVTANNRQANTPSFFPWNLTLYCLSSQSKGIQDAVAHMNDRGGNKKIPSGGGRSAEWLSSQPNRVLTSKVISHINSKYDLRIQRSLSEEMDSAQPASNESSTLPKGCSWNTKYPEGDDDDTPSRSLNWTLSVHCSNASLTAVPPGLPTTITYLHLGHNNITSLTPETFLSATQLLHLRLDYNQLTLLPTGVFSSLTQLQQLWLNSNQLTLLPAGIFSSLRQLQILWLDNNQLTFLPAGVFSSLTQLQQLWLDNNQLACLPTGIFSSLTQLQDLGLSFNQLTLLPAGIFSSSSQLQKLGLFYNQLTVLPPGVFSSLTQLQQLGLFYNQLTLLPAGVFSSMTQLQIFSDFRSLSENLLYEIGVDFFSSIMSLSLLGGSQQGDCFEQQSNSAPCPGDAVQLQLDLSGNPIQRISKTAFDLLPSNLFITLGCALPSCCGMEWLAVSPRLAPGTASQILCGNTPITSFPTGQSICQCKNQTRQNDPSACASLLNCTSALVLPGQQPYCSHTGCASGQRVYPTGSSFQCTDPNYLEDLFTLYETACQECAVANCSDCSGGLTSCDQCLPGSLLLPQTSGTSCVTDCPLGYFPNMTSAQCQACTSHCDVCDNGNTCQSCTTNYGLFSGQCFFPCPNGYGLLHGLCIACSDAPAGTSGCPLPSHSQPLAPILVPLLLSLAVAVVAGYFLWRRYRRRNQWLSLQTTSLTQQLLQTEHEVQKYRKAWQIAEEEVQFLDCIGRGAVGEVFRGKWRDMAVAIKTIKGAWMSSEEMERELDHEASMLQTVRHAHVVQFFGAGTLSDGTPFMVTELMELGTLTGVLKDQTIDLDWSTRYRFAYEIALGMALVHSLGRMHRDLKSGNILVTLVSGAMRLKVADFGTATLAGLTMGASESVNVTATKLDERAKTVRTKGVGTPLWMAPEILAGKSYGPKADMYSFGIVMWEIASRDEPWKQVEGTSFLMDELLRRILAEERPALDAAWPTKYVTILKQCWNTEPSSRPAFSEVVALLGEADVGVE